MHFLGYTFYLAYQIETMYILALHRSLSYTAHPPHSPATVLSAHPSVILSPLNSRYCYTRCHTQDLGRYSRCCCQRGTCSRILVHRPPGIRQSCPQRSHGRPFDIFTELPKDLAPDHSRKITVGGRHPCRVDLLMTSRYPDAKWMSK